MKRSLAVVMLLVWCFALLGHGQVIADPPGWQAVAGPTGGSVSAVVMSPNFATDHIVFAGLRGHGVYHSLDGGNAWQPIGLLDQVIVDLAISPNFATDHTLFAAAGLEPGNYNVYRSTDGGVTWLPPYVTPYNDGFKTLIGLSISPDYGSDHTVYALGATEMYKSTDGGQVFVKMGGWYATHHVTALALSPGFATDHTLFAAVPGSGILKSIDSGGTWAPTMFDSNDTFTALAISPDYSNDQTVAATTSYDGQLCLSNDGGAHIHCLSLHLGAGDKHTLAFSPTFATDRLMLAASSGDPGVYRSIDGGETWTPVGWYDPAHPYNDGFAGKSIYALAISPNTGDNSPIVVGASSGFYVSNYRGQDWHQNNNGLPLLTLRSFAFAPNNPATVLAGMSFFEHQHFNTTPLSEADGNLQLSYDSGHSWHDVSARIDRVRRVLFSPDVANDHTAFACAGIVGQDGYIDGGIYRSIDDAKHWSALIDAAACNDLALSPQYAIDHTAWAYVVGQGVLHTTNSGDAWSMVNNDFVAELLVVSPNYPVDHTLFATTPDARLLKSIDGGTTWTPVLSHTITALAISPAYGASQTLYAGVKEAPNSSGEIYRSGDGGAHWQKLTTGIPATVNNQPATISAIEFAQDGSILAGVAYGDTSTAMYRSIDGGQTWQALGNLSDSGLFDLTSLSSASESDQRGAFTFLAGTAHAINSRDQQQRDPAELGTWTGNGPWGGRAGLLAISPNFANDGIVFSGEVNMLRASEYGPGLFKSSDGAQTWRSVSQSADGSIAMGGEAVHAYTFSPNFAADHLVFASTSRGLYQSINSGDTWSVIEGVYSGFPGGISGLALAPDYPTSGEMIATGGWGTLVESRDFGKTWSGLAVQSSGMATYSPNFSVDHTIFTHGNDIYRSIDRGLSWTPVLTQGGYLSLSPQFGVDHTAFAASNSMSGGVSKTLNSGTTWAPILNAYVRLFLSPQYGSDQTIFALSNIGAGPYGANIMYRSINGGASWITRTIGLSTTNVGGLFLSPTFNVDHLMYATGTDGLYRSTDGGLNWSTVPDFAHRYVSTVVFSPGWPVQPYLLVGTSQSVYRSIDGGTTWTRMQGVRLLNASPLGLTADDSLWFAGTENGVYVSPDRGQSWSPLGTLSAYINELAVSPAYSFDHTVFATTSCAGCGGVGIYRTTDGGAIWNQVRSSNYSGALAISPQYATDHTLFILGSGVSRSTDGGDHWSTIGTWPPFATPYQEIALPPNYPADSTVFVAGPGFWRLPPGETQWQSGATGILSTSNVSAIAVAPNYSTSHTLLAASYDYPDVNVQSAVYRSEDGGVNWQRSDIGLPNAEWRSLAYSPHYADDHTVYLASPQQLYRSTDDGHSWIAVGATPDYSWLNQVAVSHAGDVIVSSSAGVQQYRASFRDVLINGDAEADSGWQFSSGGAAYATEINYHAQHALRLGLANGSNQPIDSFATQTVTIPISATLAQLNLRFYPVSSETNVAPHNPSGTGDAQYVTITPSGTAAISSTLLWTLSNAQTWQRTSFDLTRFTGQTIGVRIGAINDGQGGQTALYVDNASLITLGPGGGEVYLPIILKNYAN
jgi:photosystem II stability/assembly factor-like uncharacterized protein